MKHINDYITEKLTLSRTTVRHYQYEPKTKEELKELIQKRIDETPINDEIDLNDINTVHITDMSHLFYSLLGRFNDKKHREFDVSEWDVSHVKYMGNMFSDCVSFNCDLSKWDTSSCTDMFAMFSYCYAFNGDVTKWKTGNVKDMSSMFLRCEEFNQDISRWDVSNVVDMKGMFFYCKEFNQNLGRWKVSKCVTFDEMFFNCESLDFDISRWDVTNAGENTNKMFYGCRNFKKIPSWYMGTIE